MWKQMHLFDGLDIMSRESSSLLKEAEDKSYSCSTVNDELHKTLGLVKGKEFMNARQLLGRSCGRNSDLGEFPPAECSHVFLPSKSMKQLVLSNFKRLDQLHCVLQGKIVGKSSVTEKLIGCFYNVLSKGKMIEKEHFDGLEHKNKLLQETGGLVDNEVISETEFAKSVKKTVKQIDEAVQKLVSLRGSILSEDSPHRNIALWRVLYESSLLNLQLDLICETLGGTIKFGVKLLDNAQPSDSADLDQLHASIIKLIGSCNGVLLDFLAMHKTGSTILILLISIQLFARPT
ncbi:uncharacterized protein LOC113317703 [Papaver somniferum]|uniref:uncharacterized protein LOC113317703 n=1 Tax=Papaver somniferum TaxID=3469 RepID=UPI000E7007BE|nr:uncharacterized protein LOC113317703 [Papaver somniferum]XP_026421635.1 uncharacterized protein LOC113317703 [Papaver somniferum]